MDVQEIVQGDSWEFTIGVYDPIPNTNPPQPDLAKPMDLTGYAAQLQMRERAGTPAVLDLTSSPGGGLTVNEGAYDALTNPDAGTIDVIATKAQMAAIAPGLWEYACAIDNGTNRKTIAPAVPIRITPRLVQ